MADAISEGLKPAMNVLGMFTVMVDHLKSERYGLLAKFRGVRTPLSIVADAVRYRTPIVEELHETVIPFNMARKNMDGLNLVLAESGMTCFMTCSCGVVLIRTDDLPAFRASAQLRDLDTFRSSLDRAGAQVVEVASIHDVPAGNIDLTATEVLMFEEMDVLIQAMADTVPFGRAEAEAFLQEGALVAANRRLMAYAEGARLEVLTAASTIAV